jgi:hypothetical protein
MALPFLDIMTPRTYGTPAAKPIRRMINLCAPLGVHPEFFFPDKAGADYEMTPYLEVVKDFRKDFSVISGLAHPDVASTHDSIFSFLTGAPHPENRGGFRNKISMDQVAAEHIGEQTRFASIPMSSEGFGLSWTRSGALIPSEMYPSSLFAKLFLDGRPDEVEAQARRLRDGQSILDTVRDQSKSIHSALGSRDRDKLDEYFTSVRELEHRMTVSEQWSKVPKPKVNAKQPQNNMNSADFIGKNRVMFDMMHLALQTDSTRITSMLMLGTSLVPPIQGVTQGHHDLSHHGKDPAKIAQLRIIEIELMKTLGELLNKLRKTEEQGETLLDRTAVFFSSNLGNAGTHSTKNLPILLAGGGFKHGQHLAFDQTNPPPLCNLYVTMLQRMGVEVDKFSSSTGTLTGLEMKG